ncbi:MAG: ATP-grasp domain-containing protein [Eubacterium sp.]|nr:ATP-grasp domain-containing protein [Eubacterium sp.]
MALKKRKVLMLGAGPLQTPAILELKKMGAYVVCLDYNPAAEGFAYADEAKVISTTDVEAVCEEFKRQRADVIMTSASDAPVRVVSEVSERFGLPCALSYEDACAVTVKSKMRERLRENGVPIPEYRVIQKEGDLFEAYYHDFFNRCILKPSDNAGSRGVKLLEGKYGIQRLRREYEACKKYAGNGILLAEEVMEGPEVSVEALTVNGRTQVIAVTDKVVCEMPYFVEIGHREPTCLPPDVLGHVVSAAKKAISAMHIQNGPSHTEIIVTKGGPKIVEIAARLGGDFITSRLVPLSTGISMVRESVRLSLGEEVVLKKKWDRGAAIRFLFSKADGTFRQAAGIQEAAREHGIQECCLYVSCGKKVNALRSSSDRVGHIIGIGENGKDAWGNVQRAYDKIRLVLEHH